MKLKVSHYVHCWCYHWVPHLLLRGSSGMGPSSRECSLHPKGPETRQSHSGTSGTMYRLYTRQQHNMSTSVAECWLFSLFLTGYLDFLAGEFCISEAWPSQGRGTKEKIRNSLYIWSLSSLTSGPGSVYHYKSLTHARRSRRPPIAAWQVWPLIITLVSTFSISLSLFHFLPDSLLLGQRSDMYLYPLQVWKSWTSPN